MKKLSCFIILICLSFSIFAQKKITLQEIWSGEFRAEYLSEIHPLNNPAEYSVFTYDRTTKETRIDVRSFINKNSQRTLLSSKDIPIQYFENYHFSSNEKRVLLGAQMQPIYRYTSSGLYFVYDFETKQLVPVFEKPIINPQFSPDGSKVAFVFENNLYYLDIASAETIQITNDGKKNELINGLADWVYEEELELVSAFKWNPDSKQIAYFKFDESKVKEYDMQVYNNNNYPSMQTFKYPKAGEDNSKVTAHLYSVSNKKNTAINLNKYECYYLPSLQWTAKPNELAITSMNRHQNHLQIIKVNTSNTTTKAIYEEQSNSYVEYNNHLTFLDDNSFVLTSEKDGFNHLYHFSENGEELTQITKGEWTVTDFYDISSKGKKIYYQSTEGSSIERQLYEISLNGNRKRALTTKKGQHTPYFNSDYSLYLDTFTSAAIAPKTTIRSTLGNKQLLTIKDNSELIDKLTPYQLAKKEFSTQTINGHELNTWMLKPSDFDPSKKYPVLLYQYSGPNSQQVSNKWNSSNDFWFQMLVQKGYIVACIDGRGTGFKGQKFKTLTQNNLGKLETEDQIAFAKNLANLNYIDNNRIGIFGWSYGGTTALNCILKGNDVFKTAISVAPVTNWRYYDTIYTERFMKTPKENPSGYDDNSPIFHAEKLKGNLLLVHGTADDNVHLQNSIQMINALTLANKQFDLAIYTDKNHGIYGGNTRLHLYTKMTNYLLEKL